MISGRAPLSIQSWSKPSSAIAITDVAAVGEVERADAQAQHARVGRHVDARCLPRQVAASVARGRTDARRKQAHRRHVGAVVHHARVEQVQPAHAAEQQAPIAQLQRGAAVEFEVLQPVGHAERAHRAVPGSKRIRPASVPSHSRPCGDSAIENTTGTGRLPSAASSGWSKRISSPCLAHAAQARMRADPDRAVARFEHRAHEVAGERLSGASGAWRKRAGGRPSGSTRSRPSLVPAQTRPRRSSSTACTVEGSARIAPLAMCARSRRDRDRSAAGRADCVPSHERAVASRAMLRNCSVRITSSAAPA